MKIIDAHAHPRFSTPWESETAVRLGNWELEEIIRQAGEAGIERMIVLGNILRFGVDPDPAEMRLINEETAALVERHPHFFVGYCYLNPLLPKEDLEEEALTFIRDGSCVAIKLEVDCCASDRRMGPLMEIAEMLDVPVLQHAWDTKNRPLIASPKKGMQQTDGEDVAILARRHPRVRIQMAHLTGVGQTGVLAVRDCDNVWVDTSGAQPVAGMTEYALQHLGEDRVIYGSDFPIRDLRASLAKVYGAVPPGRVREKVFARNWETMTGWNPV
ncbi:MAG: amidohydrolase family protein [Oceanipulchritudo sp.]